MKKPRKDFYITEFNYVGFAPFYWVRFFENRKVIHEGRFHFKEYGGKRKAKIAAIEFRDAVCKELNHHPGMKRIRAARDSHGDKTKNIGVSIATHHKETSTGNIFTYHCVVVQWREGPASQRVTKKKSYSFDPSIKGEKESVVAKAVKLRKKMKELHYAKS